MTNAADGWTQESLFTDRPRAVRQAQPRRSARPPAVDPIPHLVDITEVAEHLGVQVRHVRRLVAGRRIPFVKWGHLLRFNPVEIREWLDQARVAPEDRVSPTARSFRNEGSGEKLRTRLGGTP